LNDEHNDLPKVHIKLELFKVFLNKGVVVPESGLLPMPFT
jgi:hypothetical protein